MYSNMKLWLLLFSCWIAPLRGQQFGFTVGAGIARFHTQREYSYVFKEPPGLALDFQLNYKNPKLPFGLKNLALHLSQYAGNIHFNEVTTALGASGKHEIKLQENVTMLGLTNYLANFKTKNNKFQASGGFCVAYKLRTLSEGYLYDDTDYRDPRFGTVYTTRKVDFLKIKSPEFRKFSYSLAFLMGYTAIIKHRKINFNLLSNFQINSEMRQKYSYAFYMFRYQFGVSIFFKK